MQVNYEHGGYYSMCLPVKETTGLVVVVRNDGTHDTYSMIETVENGVWEAQRAIVGFSEDHNVYQPM